MKLPRRTIIIADRVLPTIKAPPNNTAYTIQRDTRSAFGEDDAESREFYENLLAGYRHGPVPIDRVGFALGLFPPEDSHGPVYIEIDDWADPILISDQALSAVAIVEEVVRGEVGEAALPDSLAELVRLTPNETPALRTVIFERLWTHFTNTIGSASVPSQLLALLPWAESFNIYLEHLNRLLRGDAVAETEMPSLGHYFTYVRQGLTPCLKELTASVQARIYEDEPGLDTFLDTVWEFVSHLWAVDARYFPDETRRLLGISLARLIGLLEKFLQRTETSRIENVARSVIYLYLLCMRLRAASKRLDWQARLFNLAPALVAADRAGVFETSPAHATPLLDELRATAATLPANPAILLKDPSFKPSKPWEAPDGLINAADVCRFRAEALLSWDEQPQQALETFALAEIYYRRALSHEQVPGFRAQRGRAYKRYARALILKARILLRLDQRVDAKSALLGSIEQLNLLADQPASDEAAYAMQLYSSAVLKAEALLLLVRSFPEERSLNDELLEILHSLIQSQPEERKGYRLLLEYHSEVTGDLELAINMLDSWADEWRGRVSQSDATRRALDWLQYNAARLAAAASAADPLLTDRAVERYIRVLRDQPKNTRALAELLDLLEGFSLEQLALARVHLETQLLPVDSVCPLTHVLMRLLFCDDGAAAAEPQLYSPAIAFLRLARLSGDAAAEATDYLLAWDQRTEQTPRDRILVRRVIDWGSRAFYRRGRTNPYAAALDTADRLVELGLRLLGDRPTSGAAQRTRLVWLGRKFDIALRKSKLSDAATILATLQSDYPRERLVQLKTAVLRLHEGRLADAEAALLAASPGESEATTVTRVPPALLEKQAYLAMRQSRYQDAQALYANTLGGNRFDAAAHFGLGRVYFENAGASVDVFDAWLNALRLSVKTDSYDEAIWSWISARAIAALHSSDVRRLMLQNSWAALLIRLGNALHSEHSDTAGAIVDAFSALGIVDADATTAILHGASGVRDTLFLRRTAQFLMARTIFRTLNLVSGNSTILQEIYQHVDWCRERNVLPEYIAGAKGTYSRALLRLMIADAGLDEFDSRHSAAFEASLEPPLRELYNHVSRQGYATDYYRRSYELVGRASSLTDWPSVIKGLIRGVVSKTLERTGKAAPLLASMSPAITLWPLTLLIHSNGSDRLPTGWIDIDGVRLFQKMFPGDGWRLSGFTVDRPLMRAPSELELQAYGRSGLFFRFEGSSTAQKPYCYIQCVREEEED